MACNRFPGKMSLWKRLLGPANCCSQESTNALVTIKGLANAAPLPVSLLLARFTLARLPLTPEVSLSGSSLSKMAASEDGLELPRLPELFETSKQLLEEVEVTNEPTGSGTIQDKVFKGLDLLEKAAEMLSQLDLFRYGGKGNNGRERR